METKKYAFFKGCVIPVKLPHLEKLARIILPKMGIELEDLDFNCCPNYNVKDNDEFKWIVLAARNLAIAEEKGLPIFTLCNGCAQTLKEVKHKLQDKELLAKVNESLAKINRSVKGTCEIKHFMELMYENKDAIKAAVKKPLKGLRVATHPGCHLLRPDDIIGFDDPENPKKFDELVELLGCISLDYQKKTLCCGQAVLGDYKEASLQAVKDKIEDINGADCLAVCCPSCFSQYDRVQLLIRTKVPVLYFLQLIGLAFGMSLDEVFFPQMNRTKNPEFMEKIASF